MKKVFLGMVFLSLVFSACGQLFDNSAEVDYTKTGSVLENDLSVESLELKVLTYTLEDIFKHSEKSDCWFAINGKVYDVSEYLKHPGGDAIFQACGKDATELFETRPMGSGRPHSNRARSILNQFYIGNLIELL